MNAAQTKGRLGGGRKGLRLLHAGLAIALCSAPAFARDFVYVVQQGDNPWNLTERYLKSIDYWPRIQDYNRILQPERIQPGTVLRIPVTWMRAEAVAAAVIDVNGTVEHETAAGTAPLRPGAALAPGTVIRSGENGSLTLEFPDGSRSLVGPDTEIALQRVQRLRASKAQQTEIELRRGYLENRVRPTRDGGRYIIRTPAAIAAVRGTDFRVAARGDGMRTETLEGRVAVDNPRGRVLLGEGTGSYVGAGRRPEKSSALLPPPDLAALPQVVDRVPFRLPIDPVAGALNYRTQIAASAEFTALLSDRRTADPSAAGNADVPDGVLRVRVRAIDARGLEGLDAEREIVVDARPEPPFPSQPERDGFATDADVRFAWAHNPEALRYHFQLATDPDFEQLVLQRDDLATPGFALAEDLAPGEYHWRVAVSTDAEGRGPYSDTQRFRRPVPGPSAEPPELDGETLRLSWRAQPGVERYEVQLARDPAFAAPEYALETADTMLAMALPPSGTWHVRTRSREPGAPFGPWSKAQQIEVPYNHWKALWVLLPILLAL